MRSLFGTWSALLLGLGLQGCGGDEKAPSPIDAPRGGGAGDATDGGSSGAGSGAGGSSGAPAEGGSAGMPQGGAPSGSEGVSFTQRVVTAGLSSPWEIVWGPDDWLWITERTAGRVV